MMNEKMFQSDLLAWFDENGRDLPFRKNRSAYSIWLCEIMAQQTTIAAMLAYHERFLNRWPTVYDLAKADEEEVLKAWQGLGYYSRARNLLKCAIQVVDDYEGQFPKDVKALKKLPGIGAYTAGAIASIAYNEQVPAMDGNVLRILSRVYDLDLCIDEPSVKKEMEAMANHLVPKRAGDFNEAMMDLGAGICTPRSPGCDCCPVRSHCLAQSHGTVETRPVRKEKKEKPVFNQPVYIWLYKDNGLLFVKTQKRENGLLKGLYAFDEMPPEKSLEVIDLPGYRHVFTHKIWRILPQIHLVEKQPGFIEWTEFLKTCPLPSAWKPIVLEVEKLYGKTE